MSEASRAPAPAPIVLAPHDAAWAHEFAREAQLIERALGDILVDLQHIGSTAIPGIVAKPVIDLLGAVTSIAALDAATPHLESLGYEALGEFGLAGRRYFRKDNAAGVRTHQLHAYAAGSPDFQRHMDFRDYLRAHDDVARAYASLKQDLARQSEGDMRAYSKGKTQFIRDVEHRAATQWDR